MLLRAMTEGHAREVSTWRYPAPYDIYDMGPWELVLEKGWGLGDPEARAKEMLAAVEPSGGLLAYLRLSWHHDRWMLGVGLHPTRCGQGLGAQVVQLGMYEHLRRSPGRSLWLEVRDWNRRAIRCYEKAGFVQQGRLERVTGIGPGTFVTMHFPPLEMR